MRPTLFNGPDHVGALPSSDEGVQEKARPAFGDWRNRARGELADGTRGAFVRTTIQRLFDHLLRVLDINPVVVGASWAGFDPRARAVKVRSPTRLG